MSQILSADEIDALMQGLEEGSIDLDEIDEDIPAASKDDKKVMPFTFGQKTAIRVGALPGLDLINEHLGSQLSFKLTQKVGREVHVQPKATTNQVFGRFLHTVEPPIFINILRVEPSQSMALIAIDGDVMYTVMEGFFGGPGDSERPFRNFSPFEMKVIDRIMDVTREQIEVSWKKLDPSFRLVPTRWENQPQFAAVMPLDETVFLITFSVEVGDAEGNLTICFPAVILELFKQQLKQGFQAKEEVEGASAWMAALMDELGLARVKVTPVVAQMQMTVKQMLDLKVGDELILPTDMSEEMPIEVGGLTKFMGQAGVVDGMRAVRITRTVTKEDGFD
ncbi:flagellar motor switch protein FliM [Magnetofaba australis]|uniref:Flagellar motor switch protein FliM n=1 Tax=Magnetofaba australis IT-1 TaxID=1434232 RepID=A0A1Y2K2F5_9PROT|nr:flagellar motor switch protein FliM [Magnetofaba australis]OSM00372.1 putative flagellar motor switch protein FliM [Magnetofaba australis IT-1]